MAVARLNSIFAGIAPYVAKYMNEHDSQKDSGKGIKKEERLGLSVPTIDSAC